MDWWGKSSPCHKIVFKSYFLYTLQTIVLAAFYCSVSSSYFLTRIPSHRTHNIQYCRGLLFYQRTLLFLYNVYCSCTYTPCLLWLDRFHLRSVYSSFFVQWNITVDPSDFTTESQVLFTRYDFWMCNGRRDHFVNTNTSQNTIISARRTPVALDFERHVMFTNTAVFWYFVSGPSIIKDECIDRGFIRSQYMR